MDEKLKQFEVSSFGDTGIFWHKLTSENHWSLNYAKEIFDEYKRFIWLAKINRGEVLVPSKNIDKVWHLHMTFTRSYWHELCGDILGFEFHHMPSPNNSDAHQKDQQGYDRTLRLYEQAFGLPAFDKYWPRRRQKKYTLIKYAVFSLIGTTCLTACSLSQSGKIETALKWAVGIYVVYKILKWLLSNNGSGGKGGSNCGGCGGGCGGG